MTSASPQSPASLRAGYLFLVVAFTWWGVFPIYFKAVAAAGPLEVLCHRIVWSLPFTALLVTLGRSWPQIKAAFTTSKVLGTLCCTAILISANWLVFIYAILTGQVLAASLGYFITPMMNLLMGMIFLGERLNRGQTAAVAMAGLGTINLVITLGGMPWISLSLALTFSTYALLRKTVNIEAVGGLLVETSLLTPLALGWLVYLAANGEMAFGSAGLNVTLLLALAGVVSSIPLICFTAGARRTPLYVVGLFQYLAPTLQFILAVALYHEPFTNALFITFALVWAGLVVFILSNGQFYKKRIPGPR